MRTRERGIGNLPFIAVLVLFVIAVALFFMKQDEADTEREAGATARTALRQANERFVKMQDAYNALKEMVGVQDAALDAGGETVPEAAKIREVFQAYLNQVIAEITKASEATFQTKHYTATGGKVEESKGDAVTVRFYVPTVGDKNPTVKDFIAPLKKAFEEAARIAMENNQKFDTVKNDYDQREAAFRTARTQLESGYNADLASKQTQAEQWKSGMTQAQTANTELTATLDAERATNASKLQAADKKLRNVERERNAWRDRALNEKQKKALALEEDPADGQVLFVSNTLGTVWINLGRRHKLTRGTKFTIWRPAKGNIRQDIAVVKVINVDETKSEARIVKRINLRVPPTQGMNVSNPFFDPKGTLKVYIYGDLRTYTTNEAARRLAAAGVIVSRALDDTVNVIVLGEPPRAGDEEIPEDPEEAKAAEKKAKLDRAKRLDRIQREAISIGAIVVTEDVLATFVEY